MIRKPSPRAVDGAVYWAVSVAVEEAVDDAVYWAVEEAVDDAVYWAVEEAVDDAVHGAVDRAFRVNPPHPNLHMFLTEVRRKVP